MRSVEVDGVMALVEIEAGPFLVVAAVTRDSVEELGLAPGVAATAAVKATSVMVQRDITLESRSDLSVLWRHVPASTSTSICGRRSCSPSSGAAHGAAAPAAAGGWSSSWPATRPAPFDPRDA